MWLAELVILGTEELAGDSDVRSSCQRSSRLVSINDNTILEGAKACLILHNLRGCRFGRFACIFLGWHDEEVGVGWKWTEKVAVQRPSFGFANPLRCAVFLKASRYEAAMEVRPEKLVGEGRWRKGRGGDALWCWAVGGEG